MRCVPFVFSLARYVGNNGPNAADPSGLDESDSWLSRRWDALKRGFDEVLAGGCGLSPRQMDRLLRGEKGDGFLAEIEGILFGLADDFGVPRETIRRMALGEPPRDVTWTGVLGGVIDQILEAGPSVGVARALRGGGGARHQAPAQPKRLVLPDRKPGGKTSGLLRTPKGDELFTSGVEGPASAMPKGSPGFDIVTRTHAEGHAAAWMRQNGVMEATLHINNFEICPSCMKLLNRMLPPGAELTVITPNGVRVTFKGIAP